MKGLYYVPEVLQVDIQGHGEVLVILQHLPLKVLQEHLVLLHVVHGRLPGYKMQALFYLKFRI